MMRRFSSRVARKTSVTWSVHVLPTTVQTGAPESSSARASSRRPRGCHPRGVEPNAAIAARRQGSSRALEELGVLEVRARPAALDERDAGSSSRRADRLVLARGGMPSRWVPSRSVVS